MSVNEPPGDEVDALFALDAGEFTAARDALAKRLRSEGDKEAAAEVKAIRRPTVAAAAVNHLTRRRPEDVERLVELGRKLGQAQEGLLAGRGEGDLRTLVTERRALIADLAAGAAPAHRDAVAATLEAASADPEAAERVLAGRLTVELSPPSGFGALGEVPLPAPRTADPREERRRQAREAAEAAVDQARRGAEEAAAEVARLEQELAAARRAAREAEQRARRAEADLLRLRP